jgi:hypothetical protein
MSTDILVALLAGVGAGFLNAVAGAGTLVTFSALVALGLPPLAANVTSAVGVFPGSLTGAYTYREILRKPENRRLSVGATGAMIIGALLGIPLLLILPPKVFTWIVPWLIVTAGALTILQPWLTKRAANHAARKNLQRVTFIIGLIVAGVYLSYFGAATGVIVLSVLLYVGVNDLQQANAIKNLATGIGNCLAAILFLFIAPVVIYYAVPIAIGAAMGGLLGGRIAQRLSPIVFRIVIGFIVVVAVVITLMT